MPSLRRVVRYNRQIYHGQRDSIEPRHLASHLRTHHWERKQDDDDVGDGNRYSECIVQHVGVHTASPFYRGAGPVGGEVRPTNKDQSKEKCNRPANDEGQHP